LNSELNLILGSSFEGNEAFLYDIFKKEILWRYKAKDKVTGVVFFPGNDKMGVCDRSGQMNLFSLQRKVGSYNITSLQKIPFRSSAHLVFA
jgi:hypothetical protein